MAPHEVESSDSASESTYREPPRRKPIGSVLRVRGTEIVDGDGEPVILKGVGFQPLRAKNFAIADFD
jgi:hypothetical protein